MPTRRSCSPVSKIERTATPNQSRQLLSKLMRGWPYQLVLVPYLLVVIFPMVWLVYSSFKTNLELFASSWKLPVVPQWNNYINAWTQAGISKYFFNSVLVTTVSLVSTILLGSMVAYALSRFNFPGSQFLYSFFVAGMFIPPFIGIIPLFFLLHYLRLLNTLQGLMLVYTATNLPFTIFVLYGFFRTLPTELSDAAEVDGCSPIGAFFRVIFPMARSGLLVVGIFDFMTIWNEYLYALVLISDTKLRTLPVGVASLYVLSRYNADWTKMLAGLVILMIPTLIVYLIFQNQFREGITMGARKG
jgi:N-acetylglucosamine transport system permease protein